MLGLVARVHLSPPPIKKLAAIFEVEPAEADEFGAAIEKVSAKKTRSKK